MKQSRDEANERAAFHAEVARLARKGLGFDEITDRINAAETQPFAFPVTQEQVSGAVFALEMEQARFACAKCGNAYPIDVDGEPLPKVHECPPDYGPRLTDEQQERINAIIAQISALVEEANQIVKPTEAECQAVFDMYADDRVSELAEMLADGWGKPFDALDERTNYWDEFEQGS